MSRLVIVFLALIALTGGAQAETRKIRIGTEGTYRPFSYFDAEGKLTGFEVELDRAICAAVKADCEFVTMEFDGLIPALQEKKIDAVASGLRITEKRKKAIDFTDKYYNTPSRVVLRKAFKYDGPASVKGKKIGVLKASTQEKYALGELKPAGAEVVSYEAQDQVYLDIKAGRLDGTVADHVEVTGGFLSKPEGKDFELKGEELYIPKYFGIGAGIGLRKGQDALKGELNAAIKAIRANGTYKKINDKYFKFDVYGK